MTIAAPVTVAGGEHPEQDVPGITRPMTYEEYIAGPEEMARYDIIDGWKVYRLYGVKQLANPTREHQDIALNLAESFRAYQRSAKQGEAIIAPCDVRITYQPLRSRQPDLLFISNERLAENPPSDNPAPLSPAPELVVEIASPSDKPAALAAKIADYRAADVREVWVVRPAGRTVEVVQLDEGEPAAEFGPGEKVVSFVFPELYVAVDDLFEMSP